MITQTFTKNQDGSMTISVYKDENLIKTIEHTETQVYRKIANCNDAIDAIDTKLLSETDEETVAALQAERTVILDLLDKWENGG